tara:strand:- start:11602 stop:12195 length:594 start_codon:yes stop_codon:yes gene_type:complete
MTSNQTETPSPTSIDRSWADIVRGNNIPTSDTGIVRDNLDSHRVGPHSIGRVVVTNNDYDWRVDKQSPLYLWHIIRMAWPSEPGIDLNDIFDPEFTMNDVDLWGTGTTWNFAPGFNTDKVDLQGTGLWSMIRIIYPENNSITALWSIYQGADSLAQQEEIENIICSKLRMYIACLNDDKSWESVEPVEEEIPPSAAA